MCGIAGLVRIDGQSVEGIEVRTLTDAIRHRGPDASGVIVDRNVGIGFRRLAIIDLSDNADQPTYNEDGSVGVVFNGEIYNFQTLRVELEENGHRFRTHCDTEVLVHAWEEWGEAFVSRLRGMFAFAIYDRSQRRIFIARDRFGKKPLIYAATPDGFAFASEIKALLHLPTISRELDPSSMGEYMVYDHIVGERTIFKDLRKLPPGHCLSLDTGPGPLSPRIFRYWRYEPRPNASLDVNEWLDKLDTTLREAVRLRMISDVPLGAFLSGGIDSSLISAYMAELAPGRVKTFCIGFSEARWDESPHAKAVADYLGTDHESEIVTPDAVAILPDLASTYDEPFADPSAVPTYYLCRSARRHVTVAISGDGGDELFCGYSRYHETRTLNLLSTLLTPVGRSLARRVGEALPRGSYVSRALCRVSQRGFDLYHHALGYSEVFRPLLAPGIRDLLEANLVQEMAAEFERRADLSLLQRYQLHDIDHYLPDEILVKVDRASMRHSLEVRSPLLDQEVANLARRMPASEQLDYRNQKLLLRKLAYRYLPKELLDRPKQGFNIPLEEWFRGDLAPHIREVIADTSSPMWDYFDRQQAEQRLASFASGRTQAGKVFWRLLFFHRWASHFLA